jgi:hypothetical protein
MTTTERTEFDHEGAWNEAARPLFESLPGVVRALFALTCGVARDLHQSPNDDMPWPEDGGTLRAQFEALDDLTLATAAAASYPYGHWSPEGTAAACSGGTWKFSNYCDQVLRARLKCDHNPRSGAGLMVHEGLIRVGVSTAWRWQFVEVAPATAENARRVRESLAKFPEPTRNSKRATWDKWSDAVVARARTLRAELLPGAGDPLGRVTRAGEIYLVPYGTVSKRAEDRSRAAEDAKHDVESVARAVVAVRRSCAAINAATGRTAGSFGAEDPEHEVRLMFISTGVNESFQQRALERAAEIQRDDLAERRRAAARALRALADLGVDRMREHANTGESATDKIPGDAVSSLRALRDCAASPDVARAAREALDALGRLWAALP